MFIFFLQLLTSYLLVVNPQNPINTMGVEERIYVEGYFIRYGYTTPKLHRDEKSAAREMARAVKEFQYFAGLKETGILDEETKKIMELPRCGVPDKISSLSILKRKKRYVHQGRRWETTTLTYRITKNSRKLERRDVENIIRQAFEVWSKHSNLVFRPLAYGKADIEIEFGVKNHGDSFTFDGPGGTLAHAFYPDNGDTHFDDEENWSVRSSDKGISLLHTAIHELGHAIGLSHSSEKNSIMYFAYTKPQEPMDLHYDDIIGIQSLYGRPSNYQPNVIPTLYPVPDASTSRPVIVTSKPNFIPNERETIVSDICKDPSIDAITQTQDGSIWIFKGHYTWKINGSNFEKPNPSLIQDIWKMYGPVDAAMTLQDGNTYIFKGYYIWKFKNQEYDRSFPRYRKDIFFNLPDRGIINAAFVLSTNGSPYFIIGDEIWKPADRVNRKETSVKLNEFLHNFTETIDAALLWQDGMNEGINYFFVKDKYYKYNSDIENLDPNFPKENSIRWLGCKNSEFPTPLEYENGRLDEQKRICSCPCSASENISEVKAILLFLVLILYFSYF